MDKEFKRVPRETHLNNTRINLIGQRISELRNERGYSLLQLGMKLKVSKSAISGWEQGHRFPAIDKLDLIAETLHTSTDYLLGVTDNKKPKDIKTYLNTNNLVYDEEPLTTEQIETLNQFLSTFIIKNRNNNNDDNNIKKEVK